MAAIIGHREPIPIGNRVIQKEAKAGYGTKVGDSETTAYSIRSCFHPEGRRYDTTTYDYTLWPFWVDTHVDPPFNKRSDGKVYDGHGRQVKYYRDVPEVLKRLHTEGYKLAVASRTPCTEEARSILHLFDWNQYFTYKEIYPGTKTNHFKRFKEQSNIPYSEMLFFDDEYRNIADLNSIGVTSIHVPDGVTEGVVKEGLKQFEENIKKRRRTDL